MSAAAESIATQRPKKIRLGDLLIEKSIITQAQLDEALAKQKQTGKKLGKQLVESGFVTEDRLLDVLARQLGVSLVDLKHQSLNPEVVRLIPETQARRFRVIALESGADGLLIGMADPTDIFAYDELTRILRRPLKLAIVREADLLKAIDLLYRRTAEVTALAQELDQEMAAFDVDTARLGATDNVSDAPVVKLLQTLFEDATQINASDIHIEPEERELRIRFRIDGVLRVQTTAERRIGAALVSRLKLMAGLDISEKRLPQDGRFNARVRNSVVDVRLSTLPTQYGESAVMRLLNHTGGVIELDRIPRDDPSLSPMQLWCNESQERYVLGVAADRLALEGFTPQISTEAVDYGDYTIIYDYTGETKGTTLETLQEVLQVSDEGLIIEPNANRQVDYRVILGGRYNACTYGVLPPNPSDTSDVTD